MLAKIVYFNTCFGQSQVLMAKFGLLNFFEPGNPDVRMQEEQHLIKMLNHALSLEIYFANGKINLMYATTISMSILSHEMGFFLVLSFWLRFYTF